MQKDDWSKVGDQSVKGGSQYDTMACELCQVLTMEHTLGTDY